MITFQFVMRLVILIGLLCVLVVGIIDLRRIRRTTREAERHLRQIQANAAKWRALAEEQGHAFPDVHRIVADVYMPQDLPNQVLVEGDAAHSHVYKRVPWDQTLGDDFVSTPGAAMGIYKDLIACSCGRKYVRAVRALI